ncbi:MAG: hypothetical protein ABW128_16240, partial [Rhizorhabdus sp.]
MRQIRAATSVIEMISASCAQPAPYGRISYAALNIPVIFGASAAIGLGPSRRLQHPADRKSVIEHDM